MFHFSRPCPAPPMNPVCIIHATRCVCMSRFFRRNLCVGGERILSLLLFSFGKLRQRNVQGDEESCIQLLQQQDCVDDTLKWLHAVFSCISDTRGGNDKIRISHQTKVPLGWCKHAPERDTKYCAAVTHLIRTVQY